MKHNLYTLFISPTPSLSSLSSFLLCSLLQEHLPRYACKLRTYGDTRLGNGGGGVVLGGENVAGSPGNLGTESGQGLDQDGGLDGHMEGTGNAGALENLLGTVLLTESNETGHLVLGELNLLATESGEGNVSYSKRSLERG